MENAVLETNSDSLADYLRSNSSHPLFLAGDSREVLSSFPSECIDCAMTSPPYWGQRQYSTEGIGLEPDYREYIANLLAVIKEVGRVLKPTGSFWLNIGDTYQSKRVPGIPWRVALQLSDTQGWILRNDVIWNKVKGGPDNFEDKLRNIHEYLSHFVKSPQYYYNAGAIRTRPQQAKVVNGAVVSATGVSGIRYRRQLELSTSLSADEKKAAFAALALILQEIQEGKLADFRMIIRGQQRSTHSDSERVSGRARGSCWRKVSTSSSIIPTAPSRATCGTSFPRIPRNGNLILRPTPKTCAKFPFWPRVRRMASCSIRFAGQAQPLLWHSSLAGNPSGSTLPVIILKPPGSVAGSSSEMTCSYEARRQQGSSNRSANRPASRRSIGRTW